MAVQIFVIRMCNANKLGIITAFGLKCVNQFCNTPTSYNFLVNIHWFYNMVHIGYSYQTVYNGWGFCVYNYIDNIITKHGRLIPLDLITILGPNTFSLQATVEHHGNPIHCGIILLSIAVVKHSIVIMRELQNAIPLIHIIHQLYMYYCMNWLWSIPYKTVVGGGPLTPMVVAHLSIPLIAGRGTGTETCGIGSVFPADDIWVGLDTYTNCILIYDLLLKFYLMGCATCLVFLCVSFNLFTDGKRDDLWWPALSGHWLFCTRCC